MALQAHIRNSLASVPPFPQIANDILVALKDQNVDSQRIVSLAEKDVAITTAVLKLANSGLYGRPRSVASVRAAFQAMGAESFTDTIARVAAKKYFSDSAAQPDLNRCWAHCIACSEISKLLAAAVGLPTDIALSVGLLHDLGRFALAVAAPARHNRLLDVDAHHDIHNAECDLFGIDHTEAGRLLAEQLNLPDEFRIAAGRHHDPYSGHELDMLTVVSVACSLASAAGFQVIATSIPKSLDEIISAAPPSLRPHISPKVEFWTITLLNALSHD